MKDGVLSVLPWLGFIPILTPLTIDQEYPSAPLPLKSGWFIDENEILFTKSPLHTTKFVSPSKSGWLTCPFGSTVMVNISDGPLALTPWFVNIGTTVTIAVIGEVPVLTAVELMLPWPDVPKPISKSDDHSYVIVPPELTDVNSMKISSPSQTIKSSTGSIETEGFTVTI